MKIKAVSTLFLIAISFIGFKTRVTAQAPVSPEATAQHFYAWYLHTLNQNQEPLEKHQAELSNFVNRD